MVNGGEAYRDSISIVSREGKRTWIYPKKPGGRFHAARIAITVLLMAILVGIPFITVRGQPFVLFDVLDRRFILFASVFGPHDFYLLALAVITGVVFIILFTVVFGRLFCGWVCPQTVLMEMVFRKVDYWLEGDHRQQRRLNASPWTRDKVARKLAKYAVYFGLSFLISNMLLAWVIGVDRLWTIVTDPPGEHLAGLAAMLVFTAVFYWIFAWFREQACILICPYGRLQGVLLDSNSIVIAYDHVRGEPRGRLRRNVPRSEGDCIDCSQCVEVCPTGIDIRNGTQLECVNCTACIDACDDIMVKIGKPRGLVRYDSANGIASSKRKLWTPRVIGTTTLLVVLGSILGAMLVTRTELDVTILRAPGMFYQEHPDGRISNVYDVTVVNKTFASMPLLFRLKGIEGTLEVIGGDMTVAPQAVQEAKILVFLAADRLTAMSTPLAIDVVSGTASVGAVTTTFLGPVRRR